MNKLVCAGVMVLLTACSPSKPTVPSLNPGQAAALLQYHHRAQGFLTYVKKNNPNCQYRLDLPDQSSNPTTIDLDHIVVCGGRPAPKEFDASVSFEYDKAAGTWKITRFAS